ncbi:MAG TPA: hypothetical protein VN883_04685 [Myxococcales bacterium]|nr:hypothetical protein [Myxococcales bacterium]
MIRSHSRSAVPLLAILSTALVGACGGRTSAQAPVSTIALPSGAALKAWDTTKVNAASPAGMAAVSTTQIYVALNNIDPASYAPNGPGLLVGFNPYTGSTVTIDLAVATPIAPAERSCASNGVVKADSGKLYAACSGSYSTPAGSGRALVEVDPGTNAVTRILALPPSLSFMPYALAAASTKIWLGNAAAPSLASVDRATWALVDGASASQPQGLTVNCTDTTFGYISDAAVYGGELFVLCGSNSNGEIVRLDAATGAFKDKKLVGAQPVKMTQLPDGRIAIVNSIANTVSFVTIAPTALTVAKDAIVLGAGADLEGVAFFDRYLFTVSSATQTVQKIDLAATGGPKIVAEVNTGNGSGPLSVVPLDANHAVVSASLTGKIVGVTFP